MDIKEKRKGKTGVTRFDEVAQDGNSVPGGNAFSAGFNMRLKPR